MNFPVNFPDMNASRALSKVVWTEAGHRLYSFEQAAYLTQTSVPLLEQDVSLGLIEPSGAMLQREALIRVIKIRRLRHDLGLNLVGAAMVLDMATEIQRLKAQLRLYRDRQGI
jgi:MerR family transcriptional regulator/heat shock protein HspR/chaperone modulatory protein CbpM